MAGNYHLCENCMYSNTCNREAINYSSTGNCDIRKEGYAGPPKIETPPDERFDNIWNW